MDANAFIKSVNEHYGVDNLGETILNALREEGKDPGHISHQDLAAVDHFHSRGREATLDLAEMAGIKAGEKVLDVGGGIGGPARTLAAEFGADVTVLDLTEEYCRTGEMLTERCGLGDKVRFKVGNALDIPFDGESFDVVWTQHSSMNIADKEGLYRECYRVLRPGGRLAIHEIMAGEVQPIHFPVPWADDEEISFLRTPQEIRAVITETEFKDVLWTDVTEHTIAWLQQQRAAAAGGGPGPLGQQLLLGEKLSDARKNVAINLNERRLAIVQAVFRK